MGLLFFQQYLLLQNAAHSSGERKCLCDISCVSVCSKPRGQASARSADYFTAPKTEVDLGAGGDILLFRMW